MRNILVKLDKEVSNDDLDDLVHQVQELLSRRIEGKSLLEILMDGSKKQPASVVNVLVFHCLKHKFDSLTHATEVLGLNIKTLTVNYELLLDALNKAENSKYKVVISDWNGDAVITSYVSETIFKTIINILDDTAFQVTS